MEIALAALGIIAQAAPGLLAMLSLLGGGVLTIAMGSTDGPEGLASGIAISGLFCAGAAVILLGPHLGDQLPAVRETAARAGVAVAVLSQTVFASPSGDEALNLALDAAGAMSAQGQPQRSNGGPTHG